MNEQKEQIHNNDQVTHSTLKIEDVPNFYVAIFISRNMPETSRAESAEKMHEQSEWNEVKLVENRCQQCFSRHFN